MQISIFTYLVLLLSVVFISHQVNLESAAAFFTALIVSVILSKFVSLGIVSARPTSTTKSPDETAVRFGSILFFVICWGGIISLLAHILLQRFQLALCPGFSSNVLGMVAMIILPLSLLNVFNGFSDSKAINSMTMWTAELLSGSIFAGGLFFYGFSHWLSAETAIAWWASGLFVATVFVVIVAWAASGKNKSISLRVLVRLVMARKFDFLRDVFLSISPYLGIIVAFRFLDAAYAGLLALVMLFGELIWRLPVLFSGNKHPEASRVLILPKELGLNRLFSWALLVVDVVILGYLALSYGLLKNSASESWYLIFAVIPGMLGFLYTRTLIRAFAFAGQNFVSVVVAILAFLVHFDLSLILLSKWGGIGIASAFSITYLFSGGALVLLYKNRTQCQWRDLFKFSLRVPKEKMSDNEGALA